MKNFDYRQLYNSNSGEIQKNDYIQTTSYFEIAFY